jgi:hypothetical protein
MVRGERSRQSKEQSGAPKMTVPIEALGTQCQAHRSGDRNVCRPLPGQPQRLPRLRPSPASTGTRGSPAVLASGGVMPGPFTHIYTARRVARLPHRGRHGGFRKGG